MDDVLKSFLIELAVNPRKVAEYMRDREAYLEETSLSTEAKQAILSGDPNRVTKLMGSAMGGHTKAKIKVLKPKPKKKPKKKVTKKKKAAKKK